MGPSSQAVVRGPRFINRVGEVHGRLTVIAEAAKQGKNLCWTCRCECGTQKVVRGSHLADGRTRSCGCLVVDVLATQNRVTSCAETRAMYGWWKGIIYRCTKVTDPNYHRYGGRGITICDRWLRSVEAFISDIDRDLGPRPIGHSLDRKDNDGNYEPGNVRWATSKTQNRNRRDNRLIEFDGVVHCLSEWAEIAGISSEALYQRLRRGWSLSESINGRVK